MFSRYILAFNYIDFLIFLKLGRIIIRIYVYLSILFECFIFNIVFDCTHFELCKVKQWYNVIRELCFVAWYWCI